MLWLGFDGIWITEFLLLLRLRFEISFGEQYLLSETFLGLVVQWDDSIHIPAAASLILGLATGFPLFYNIPVVCLLLYHVNLHFCGQNLHLNF